MSKKWDEPEEFKVIKDYVRNKYNSQVGLKQNEKSIIISAPSAALAGTLRMDLNKLQKELKSDKKLVIRIGWWYKPERSRANCST